MSQIQGSQNAIEQPSVLTFVPGEGERTTRVFRGVSSAINSEYAIRVSQGYACTLRRGGNGIDTLEATIGANAQNGGSGIETPIESWSLSSNNVEKDILESDVAAVADITKSDKEKILKAIQSPDDTMSPVVTGDALEAYLLMLAGVRSIKVSQPVLRGSYLATANYARRMQTSNVGAVFTNANLQSLEGVPGTLLIELPSSSKATQFDGTGDKPDARYGWLKAFPTSEIVSLDQFRVSVEYEYGLWATLLYPNAA